MTTKQDDMKNKNAKQGDQKQGAKPAAKAGDNKNQSKAPNRK